MDKQYLFIWDDVLSDYTSGIAFAVAETDDKALKKLKSQMREFEYSQIVTTKPRKISVSSLKACGWVCGGG